MPQTYSRSRAKFSSYGDGPYDQGPYRPGGGNSMWKWIGIAGGVVAVVVVAVLLWPTLSDALRSGGGQPSATPAGTSLATPLPTTSVAPTSADATQEPTVEPTSTLEPTATPTPFVDFTISASGQILIESGPLAGAKTSDGEYDFAPMFDGMKDSLSKADLTLATLESTLAGKDATYSGTTKFNTPESILTAMKGAGIDFLSNAHSHIFDKGFSGVEKTISFMSEAGLSHTGAYLSADDYHATPMITIPDKNVKVAVLAYSEDEKFKNLISADKMRFAIKHINLETIKKDVKAAREAGANAVIVMLHWDNASAKTPTSAMTTQVKKIIGYGADLIIGSGPLYLHKIEKIKAEKEDGTETEGIVAYSLGSLVSGQQAQYKDTGAILNVSFRLDTATNMVSITNATYVPTWVYLKDKKYTILPAGKYKESSDLLGTLSGTGQTRIKKAYDEAVAALGSTDATAVAE